MTLLYLLPPSPEQHFPIFFEYVSNLVEIFPQTSDVLSNSKLKLLLLNLETNCELNRKKKLKHFKIYVKQTHENNLKIFNMPSAFHQADNGKGS